MRCCLLNLEAQEEDQQKEIELKDKVMEQRNSSGPVATGFPRVATLILHGQVHWIPE
jgi:hypothetical protein